ncbi:hypothetical protein SUGI_0723070 [Cryptomeria japonica]|nr:hypothetical protein SUGI_0723070 [Cryptomeria japonica]
MGKTLLSQISLSTLDVAHSNLVCSHPQVPSHNSAAVGINQKITEGWKYSKVTLIKNLELNPNIEEIQSQILSDLTGIKHGVRQDGQKELKSIIEREVVFIYIDNILKREHLEMLLPKLIDSPKKKLRILATARKTNISGVFESC